MIEGLQAFLDELRKEGMRISPGEGLDAFRALRQLDLGRREQVRTALAASLVKRRDWRGPFDKAFDRFFVGPSHSGDRKGKKRGSGGGDSPHSHKSAPPRPTQGKQARPQRPTRPTATPPESRRKSTPPLSQPVRERSRDLLRRARRGEPLPDKLPGKLIRLILEPRKPRGTETRPDRLRLRKRLTLEQERLIVEELPRRLAQLRHRPSRRQRRAKRGQVYLRRLFRANAAFGGIPWILPRRSRRRKPPKLVLLLDVSWSVARSSGLFLLMAEELLRRLRDVRIFFFVDRPIEVTDRLPRWLVSERGVPHAVPHAASGTPQPSSPGRRPAAGIVKNGLSFSGFLESLTDLAPNAPSDYGRTFHGLSQVRRIFDSRTVMLVLGDGRNNRFQSQSFALEEIRERIRSVLWLVPEPVREWGVADSALHAYLPHVDLMVETADLDGLVRGFAELRRRIG